MEYYQFSLNQKVEDLTYRYLDPTGRDLTPILRGQISVLYEFLHVEDTIVNYEKSEKKES